VLEMVHKTNILPGLTTFVDNNVLAHYPPTSLKRILAAGAIALYLNRNSDMVDRLLNNPLISNLGVSTSDGMIDIDLIRDVYKSEIAKAGFLRIHFPIIGDVDFTTDDVDVLYRCIMNISAPNPVNQVPNQGYYN
jgi:hypothetical protein